VYSGEKVKNHLATLQMKSIELETRSFAETFLSPAESTRFHLLEQPLAIETCARPCYTATFFYLYPTAGLNYESL
jgi:hypothetical protein